ncbi:MAG: S41 family peptidase [Bacteroidota bacterium]
MIKTTFFLGLGLLLSFFQTHDVVEVHRSAERLSVEELQEDFAFFRARLKRYHPGLYTYASGSEIDSAFAAIEAQLTQPMDDLAFYQLLSPLKSLIKDGHTYFYPNIYTRKQLTNQSSLPFNVYWDWEKLWVSALYVTDTELKAGDKIISINQVEAAEIVAKLMANIIRDGENDTYPRWIMHQWFNEIYHYHYEVAEEWEIEIENSEGQRQKITLPNPPLRSVPEQGNTTKGIELRYEGEVAILKVASFNDLVLKKRYGQKFRPAIKQAFAEIDERRSQKLILDLRDNQGGEIDNGRYLLSVLLEERFSLVQSLKKVVMSEQVADSARLSDKIFSDIKWTEAHFPFYDGELVILINGGSFSCSGAVIGQLKSSLRGYIIGEESGGNRRTFCGVGPDEQLPNSKISLSVPRVQFQVVDRGANPGAGVMPDLYMVPSISDLLEGRDVVLAKALEVINN